MKNKIIIVLLLLAHVLGCAPLMTTIAPPTVSVTTFRVLPGQELVPTFEIGLHVVNHNWTDLKLEGVSYQVELEGHRIINGASNQLPVIKAYGEGDIVLQVQPDLFSSINLFADLMSRPRKGLTFNLHAILDFGGLMPKIPIHKEGTISLLE